MNSQTLKSRIATLALGHTVDQVTVRLFDYVLYPAAMIYFGAVWGSVVMIFASFLVCLLTMKFYDWSKTDWLGLEYLKQLREDGKEEGNRFSRALSWALRKGNWAVLIVLSLYKDPFYATVYMRKGANQYTGMGKYEWKIFLASLIIANLYWTVLVNVGLTSLKFAWHYIMG